MAYLAGKPISNFTQPQLVWNQPAAGSATVAVKHTVGTAWLMQRGVFLIGGGVDYTEDANGFYLTNVVADGNEMFGVWMLNPINVSGMLSATNPVIGSGGLTFADGTVQNSAGPRSNRNYIVDGAMAYAYPNQSSTAVNGYTQLAMYVSQLGTGGAAICQQAISGMGILPVAANDSVSSLLQWSQTTASTGTVAAGTAPAIYTKIESVRVLQGRSATFSCWISNYGSTPFTIPAIVAAQIFGTGGSPSPTVSFPKTVNWVIPPGGWYKYSVRLDFPSIQGMQVGSNGNDYIQVGLWLPSNVLFNMNTTQWQLEQSSPLSSSDINGNGGAPTVFEWRGNPMETMRCARFLQWSFVANQYGFQGNATDPYRNWIVGYPVAMRGAPAIQTGSSGAAIGIVGNGLVGFTANMNAGNTNTTYAMTSWLSDARL